MAKEGLFSKLKEGLKKTRDSISSRVDSIIAGFKKIDADFLEELEEALISADIGVLTTEYLIGELKRLAAERKIMETSAVRGLLREIIANMMRREEKPLGYPAVILVVGVNGVGKTTNIGKLAHYYKQAGKSVLLAAGDTFRAAAAEQLSLWAGRANVPIVKHKEGADPAAVIYDAIQSARAKNADVLICDTAGRLQTKKNLMHELGKIGRIISREYSGADMRTLLVLDATTGQNAVAQARVFGEAVALDGIILTKMDGTAKGGIVLAIMKELGIPVCYIGVGEKMDDLQPFDADAFAEAII